MLKEMQGKNIKLTDGTYQITKEGKKAVHEAIGFLKVRCVDW